MRFTRLILLRLLLLLFFLFLVCFGLQNVGIAANATLLVVGVHAKRLGDRGHGHHRRYRLGLQLGVTRGFGQRLVVQRLITGVIGRMLWRLSWRSGRGHVDQAETLVLRGQQHVGLQILVARHVVRGDGRHRRGQC